MLAVVYIFHGEGLFDTTKNHGEKTNLFASASCSSDSSAILLPELSSSAILSVRWTRAWEMWTAGRNSLMSHFSF